MANESFEKIFIECVRRSCIQIRIHKHRQQVGELVGKLAKGLFLTQALLGLQEGDKQRLSMEVNAIRGRRSVLDGRRKIADDVLPRKYGPIR